MSIERLSGTKIVKWSDGSFSIIGKELVNKSHACVLVVHGFNQLLHTIAGSIIASTDLLQKRSLSKGTGQKTLLSAIFPRWRWQFTWAYLKNPMTVTQHRMYVYTYCSNYRKCEYENDNILPVWFSYAWCTICFFFFHLRFLFALLLSLFTLDVKNMPGSFSSYVRLKLAAPAALQLPLLESLRQWIGNFALLYVSIKGLTDGRTNWLHDCYSYSTIYE